MADEKTEQPTERKLKKLREEGKVAKSADLAEFACLAAALLALYAGEHFMADSLRSVVGTALSFVGGDHSIPSLLAALKTIGRAAALMILPVAALSSAAGVMAMAPQTGLTISMAPIMPKFDAVNPGSGLQRIISMKALLDLAKMVIKALIVFLVMWKTIEQMIPLIASSLYQSPEQLAGMLWSVILRVLAVAAAIYLVIGAVDYKIAKNMFIRQNRMSKDEVKREHKEQDGDPMLKSKRKRLARELVNGAPAEPSLKRANMLVVNPTHYAVAVRYAPSEFPLPIIVAKGVDAEAAMLRRLAFGMGLPIVANPPVARALYKVPDDEAIPEELFEVVASILRWVNSVGARRNAIEMP